MKFVKISNFNIIVTTKKINKFATLKKHLTQQFLPKLKKQKDHVMHLL
jgi:hypothetical protein